MGILHALFAQNLVAGQMVAVAGFVLLAQNLVAGQMVAVAGLVLLALVERFDYNNRPLQLGLQGYFLQL